MKYMFLLFLVSCSSYEQTDYDICKIKDRAEFLKQIERRCQGNQECRLSVTYNCWSKL